MTLLFGEDSGPRIIAPGAVHVPGWLTLEQQSWIAARHAEWAKGPVPERAARVGAHQMSVHTVSLGWHWRPSAYSRTAVDAGGGRVLAFPEWMVRLGRRALTETGFPPELIAAYTPDVALVNRYDVNSRMGMHQDRDELSAEPVISLSIGETARFRFGNTSGRGKPWTDLLLASGDLFIFAGPSRRAFHGVRGIIPDTAPRGCGVTGSRLNITMRHTGLPDSTPRIPQGDTP